MPRAQSGERKWTACLEVGSQHSLSLGAPGGWWRTQGMLANTKIFLTSGKLFHVHIVCVQW